jgi:hypothetical protein
LPRAKPVQTAALHADAGLTRTAARSDAPRQEARVAPRQTVRDHHQQPDARQQQPRRQHAQGPAREEPNGFQKFMGKVSNFITGAPTPASAYTPAERAAKAQLAQAVHGPYVGKLPKPAPNGSMYIDGSAWPLKDGGIVQYTDAALFVVPASKNPKMRSFDVEGNYAKMNGYRLEMQNGEGYIQFRKIMNEVTKSGVAAVMSGGIGAAVSTTNIVAQAAIQAAPRIVIDTAADASSYHGHDDLQRNPERFVRRNGFRAAITFGTALLGRVADREITKHYDAKATRIQNDGVTAYRAEATARVHTMTPAQAQAKLAAARADAVNVHNTGEMYGNYARQLTSQVGNHYAKKPVDKMFRNARERDHYQAAGVNPAQFKKDKHAQRPQYGHQMRGNVTVNGVPQPNPN